MLHKALALLALLALPATAYELTDSDGIAWTDYAVANIGMRQCLESGGTESCSVSIPIQIRVNVALAALWHGASVGTYNARLQCTAGVINRGSETGSRTGVSNAVETTFEMSVVSARNPNSHPRIASGGPPGRELLRERCSLRIVLRAAGEDTPVRHVLLPVIVERAERKDRA